MIVLIFHLILQDHVAFYVTDSQGKRVPSTSGGDRLCSSGGIMVLVCHVILQDHLVEGSCDFMTWSFSR